MITLAVYMYKYVHTKVLNKTGTFTTWPVDIYAAYLNTVTSATFALSFSFEYPPPFLKLVTHFFYEKHSLDSCPCVWWCSHHFSFPCFADFAFGADSETPGNLGVRVLTWLVLLLYRKWVGLVPRCLWQRRWTCSIQEFVVGHLRVWKPKIWNRHWTSCW
jgi:hypothetical protein